MQHRLTCWLIVLAGMALSLATAATKHSPGSRFMSYEGRVMCGYQGWCMLNVCEFRLENLRTLVITVCEFAAKIHSHADREEQYQTLAEAQIRNQVYVLILHWLEKIETLQNCSVSRERAATAASWAIYGLAHQWTHEKRRSPAETFADEVMPVVAANLGQTVALTG